jgi:hypothetical protein
MQSTKVALHFVDTSILVLRPSAIAGTVCLCADLKLLVLRQHTGGIAAGMSGDAVIKLAQTLMSTELRGLLQARAVSTRPCLGLQLN